ncbi:unnamed protein product [Didymodactylos carnosus]|uniref:ZMYM2-like/QRICH1 C-terminal domain-containing protein n=1 Tax=Didymodactylos carnosus TaxID=1234261 RepID=A0A8S2Q771_9BILA|nr:unnamed protein product [Didymodactylos carnosus]CAF4086609.1 unnamed protein product [Didymodactylos carnosus]
MLKFHNRHIPLEINKIPLSVNNDVVSKRPKRYQFPRVFTGDDFSSDNDNDNNKLEILNNNYNQSNEFNYDFQISSDTNSHNTIRKTKHDVKRFVMYIDEKFSEKCQLHKIKPDMLCIYLKHYFENTKKFDGTDYEPDTLRSFLLSVERYLKSKKYEYNLMESSIFQSCRNVILVKRDQWRKLGKTTFQTNIDIFNIKHELILREKNLINRETPDGLLLEILINNSKYFDQKSTTLSTTNNNNGFESTVNKSLLWGDIELINDEYLEYNRKQTKLNEGNSCNNTTSSSSNIIHPRAYANPADLSKCPVQAYKMYTSHRPQQSNTLQSPFYLVPRISNFQRVWYKTMAAGKHRLDQLLQNSMSRAGIQGKFQLSSMKKVKSKDILPSLPLSTTIENESLPLSVIIPSGTQFEEKDSPSCKHLSKRKRHNSLLSIEQPLNLCLNNTDDDQKSLSSSTSSSSSTYSTNDCNNNSKDDLVIKITKSNINDRTPLLNGLLKMSTTTTTTTSTATTPTVNNETTNNFAVVKESSSSISKQNNEFIWDESVTLILMSVAKQKENRIQKINTLRTYLEDKMGVVEFLCLYRHFKSEPKLTFQNTVWEHYQRYLPVLFTLLTLDNTTN